MASDRIISLKQPINDKRDALEKTHMYLKRFSLASLAGVLTLSIGASTVTAADLAVIVKTLTNPFHVAIKEGVLKEAKAQGVDIDVFAANGEEDIQGEQRIMEDLINKHYKAIGVVPITEVNLVQDIAAANKKGIYVVNIDQGINEDRLKAAGGSLVAYVGTDNKVLGEKAGNFIVKKLGPDGGKVAIIEGKAGTASDDRRNGASKAFEGVKNVEIVAKLPADWDRTKALDVTTNILQRNPDLKAIYAANDTMALGAVQAIKNANKLGKVIVVGTDGVPEAVSSVQRGELTATVAQDAGGMGTACVNLLLDVLKNKPAIDPAKPTKFIPVESQLITKQ